MYYVYVLECRDGSLYAGMTNDLRRRMTLHAAGVKYLSAPPNSTRCACRHQQVVSPSMGAAYSFMSTI